METYGETDRKSEREKGSKLTDAQINKLWELGVKESETALGW